MLRTIAKYTDLCNGEKQKIIDESKKYIERELTENELETISNFVNGY